MSRSAVLSLLTHAAAIIFILVMPETFMQPKYREKPEEIFTPLVLPPLTLTQKEPNPTKTIREMRSPDLTPRPPVPPGPSPNPQTAAGRKSAPPPPQAPKTSPQTLLPEPPKVEIAANEPPKLPFGQAPNVPQPKVKPQFEDVGPVSPLPPGQRVIPVPGTGIGVGAGGATRGLPGQGTSPIGSAPVPSSGAALPQLLSDPGGVEWGPYLSHVLEAVERTWRQFMPASKRMGMVSVQFSIKRDGTVGKASFVRQTGDTGLDMGAIRAISGGGPFGPLPAQYRGEEIHVQMNFQYNVPVH